MSILTTGAISSAGIILAHPVGGTIVTGAYITLQLTSGNGTLYNNPCFGAMSTWNPGFNDFVQVIASGSGYATGTYNNVPMISLNGVETGVLATISAVGGHITTCEISSGGSFFSGVNGSTNYYTDMLAVTTASVGGVGGGAIVQTSNFLGSIGAQTLDSQTWYLLVIASYGTNGTTGVGGAGTYQVVTTASGVGGGAPFGPTPGSIPPGQSSDPGLISVYGTAAWLITPTNVPPPQAYSAPVGQMEPVPNLLNNFNTVFPWGVAADPPVGTMDDPLPNILATSSAIVLNLQYTAIPPVPLPGITTSSGSGNGVSSYAI